MATKEKQSFSSTEADQDTSRVLAHVLRDQRVALAVDELIKSVTMSQFAQINGRLDAIARPSTFKQVASFLASSLIPLVLGFGVGVFMHDKGWPVMAWVTQLFA
jgi:hypothetical protein